MHRSASPARPALPFLASALRPSRPLSAITDTYTPPRANCQRGDSGDEPVRRAEQNRSTADLAQVAWWLASLFARTQDERRRTFAHWLWVQRRPLVGGAPATRTPEDLDLAVGGAVMRCATGRHAVMIGDVATSSSSGPDMPYTQDVNATCCARQHRPIRGGCRGPCGPTNRTRFAAWRWRQGSEVS